MRSYHRKKLNGLLSLAEDEGFVQLAWAVHMLQSDDAKVGRAYLDRRTIPDGAETTEISSKFAIQKWEIETLVNELMTVPAAKPRTNGIVRTLRHDHFQALVDCTNRLRDLENSEFRIRKKKEEVFIEMGRIAARQFDWQTGYVNGSQFYRNAFVYGQGECAKYFEATHGISLNDFSKIGFILYVAFTMQPIVQNGPYWEKIGVPWSDVEKVLSLIARPFSIAAKMATRNRSSIIHTADKPSILRQYPCLRFGKDGERIRSPLPELILERVTSGVFYDIVGAGGVVRDEYGRRFEAYCLRHLSDSLPVFKWEPEFKYRKKPNTFDTPDILCSDNAGLKYAVECKSTRMSHQAMFGLNPIEARGYEDLSKAVFQLWRFFSHSRRGYTGRKVSADAVGVVLTLDNWLVMAESLRTEVLDNAHKIAADKDLLISEADKKPIVFVTMPELERALAVATEKSFAEAISKSNTEQLQGWRLDSVVRDIGREQGLPKKKYPYTKELGKLLPWWDEIRAT